MSGFRFVAGEAELTSYRSSPPVRRSFCRTCGSSLFFQHDAVPELMFVAVGTLDEVLTSALPFDAHCFVGSKASWWTIHDALTRHEQQRPEFGG